jgi:release factor glutamine methyltransferase
MSDSMDANSELNPEAEKYISKILQEQIPYQVKIANATFIISNQHFFPPGKLSQLFVDYLITNDLIENKIIVDAGAGCFTLGIVAAKNGAKTVIGIDISEHAVTCANQNIILNQVEKTARIVQEDGLSRLLPEYAHQVDALLCGAPWDTITQKAFNSISVERQSLSRAFYDINDTLITDVLSKGPMLLSPKGKIFITASMRVMNRIKKLCETHQCIPRIVKEKDIHQDGNVHYILEITH